MCGKSALRAVTCLVNIGVDGANVLADEGVMALHGKLYEEKGVSYACNPDLKPRGLSGKSAKMIGIGVSAKVSGKKVRGREVSDEARSLHLSRSREDSLDLFSGDNDPLGLVRISHCNTLPLK